jgi:esterase/lipase superfamily enzyme
VLKDEMQNKESIIMLPLRRRMKRFLYIMILCGLALVCAACSTKLMPTPAAFEAGHVDPLQNVPADQQNQTLKVYVVTNRKPSGQANPAIYYSMDRADVLRLASATVKVNGYDDWNALRTASLHGATPTMRLTTLDDFGPLWTTIPPDPLGFVRQPTAKASELAPAQRFAAELNAKLSQSQQKDIFIFVHGFNTAFPNNIKVAAGLHFYLGREGVVILYAWPSQDSLFSYSADKASARYSARYFRLFLEFLAAHTEAEQIHIIGHSAGAPVTVHALQQLRLRHFDEEPAVLHKKYRIGTLILAAADMDHGGYDNAALDGYYQIPKTHVIYMSTKDKALALSSSIYDVSRVGESLKSLTPAEIDEIKTDPTLQVIDVTNAEKHHGSFLGHSYWYLDSWVNSDVILLLRSGVSPAQRGLMRRDADGVWYFPPDYPGRVKQDAAQIFAR